MFTYRRLTKLLRGYKRYFIPAIVAAFLGVSFYLIRPIILKITVDSILDTKPLESGAIIQSIIDGLGGIDSLRERMWIPGLFVCGSIFFYCLFIFIRDRLGALASEGFAKDLKDRLYNHIQCMPYDYHVKAKTGDLIQRCTSDVETVRRFLSVQMISVARILFTVVFSLIVMFATNVKMTFIALIATPFIFLFSYFFHKVVRRDFQKSDEMEGELSTVLQESLTGVRVVRAFGRQRFELDKFTAKNEALSKLNFKLIHYLAMYWSISDLLIYAQLAGMLLFGIFMVTGGEVTLGTLILFMSYESSLLWPIRQLGRVLSDLGKMQIALERVFDVLDSKEEEHDPNALKPSLDGDIEFKDLSFAYDGSKPVLKDLSFTVKKGQTVAVLGTTGSGKSSIMHLLLRLYDYKEGSVKINGTELKQIDKHWLRENIGMVLQEPFLYSKNIIDNLRMARFEATDDEIFDAARSASAHDFITGFEKGYETMVGERGVTLSGGQKQRVAIARTLIKNSQILIFDDSLSAVDTETDAQIRAALKEKQKDVTTFIISQRITTLMNADTILVFEDGRMTERGSHLELSESGGLYSRIWKIQNMLEEDFEKEAMA